MMETNLSGLGFQAWGGVQVSGFRILRIQLNLPLTFRRVTTRMKP